MGIYGIIDISGGKEAREGLRAFIDANLDGVSDYATITETEDATRVDLDTNGSDAWWEWNEELAVLRTEAMKRGLSIKGTVTRSGEDRDDVERADLSDDAIRIQQARLVFPDGSEA